MVRQGSRGSFHIPVALSEHEGQLLRHPDMWPLADWIKLDNASSIQEEERWVVIEKDGTMAARIKVDATFTSHMDVANHPLDKQKLTVRLRAAERAQRLFLRFNTSYTSTITCVDHQAGEDGDGGSFHLKDEYDVSPIITMAFGFTPKRLSGAGYQYSSVDIQINVARKPASTVVAIFLPMLVVAAMSMCKYYIPLEQVSERIQADFALVLAAIAIKQQSSNDRQTPQVAYLTCTDLFSMICLCLVGLSTFELLLIASLSQYREMQAFVDSVCYWLLFVTVVVLGLVAVSICFHDRRICYCVRVPSCCKASCRSLSQCLLGCLTSCCP